MSLEVRRAVAEDVDALLRLQREVHELHLLNRPQDFNAIDDAAAATWFHAVLKSPETHIWVAVDAGEIVGNAVAVQKHRTGHPLSPARSWCEVDQIVVTRTQRRKGIARALLQAVVEEAHSRGTRDIELMSWSFNHEAHRAFESFGFAPKIIRFELRSR